MRTAATHPTRRRALAGGAAGLWLACRAGTGPSGGLVERARRTGVTLPSPPQRPTTPTTKEIPVAQPTVGATTAGTTTAGSTQVLSPPDSAGAGPTPISVPLPPPPAPSAPEPTGPVDFVPEPPGATAAGKAKPRAARDRAGLAGLGLVIASVLLLEAGLLLRFGGEHSFWTTVPLWSGFATLAALLGLLAHAGRHPKGAQLRNDRAWKIAGAGLTGLAVFWVLVVLPVANTDRGFVLTAALGCLGVALWIAPGRKA